MSDAGEPAAEPEPEPEVSGDAGGVGPADGGDAPAADAPDAAPEPDAGADAAATDAAAPDADADAEVAAAAALPGDETMPTGRSFELLNSTRNFRRRVGERRITAPVKVIQAFVQALFRGIQGAGPAVWAPGEEDEGLQVEDLLHFVGEQRYRLEATITDEHARQMFAEADLRRDGLLDKEELANTALSYGMESVHLPQWCALFNLFVDPHVRALAMPLRVTKRHPIQSNAENYEEARMFKPNLTATHAHGKVDITSRDADGLAVRRCDGRRDVVEYPHSDKLNESVMSGASDRPDGSATFSFAAQDAYNAGLAAAADASEESQGAIAQHKPHAARYAPWPRPWISSAIAELSWPAVPGSDPRTALTVKEQPAPPSKPDFFTNFHLDSNQDMRTEYAQEFLSELGPYHPPSMHKFREEADPQAHGHERNFQRFMQNREPCVRPFESQRTGKYNPPSTHSFRVPLGPAPGESPSPCSSTILLALVAIGPLGCQESERWLAGCSCRGVAAPVGASPDDQVRDRLWQEAEAPRHRQRPGVPAAAAAGHRPVQGAQGDGEGRDAQPHAAPDVRGQRRGLPTLMKCRRVESSRNLRMHAFRAFMPSRPTDNSCQTQRPGHTKE